MGRGGNVQCALDWKSPASLNTIDCFLDFVFVTGHIIQWKLCVVIKSLYAHTLSSTLSRPTEVKKS